MGKVVFEISMSVDGLLAGPKDVPGQGLGEGGEVLHEWLFSDDGESEPVHGMRLPPEGERVLQQSLGEAGAAVVGRVMYDNSGAWGGSPPFPMPYFVVTHEPPEDPGTGFTYVDGVERAV